MAQSPPLLPDNFHFGFRAPPLTFVIPTGIPAVGTGPNDIPATIQMDAAYALFSYCALDTTSVMGINGSGNSGTGPQTIPITITTADVSYFDEKQVTITVGSSSPFLPDTSFPCYARYSRTWWSVDQKRQIWRFLIQGESFWPDDINLGTYPYGAECPPCLNANGPDNAPVFQGFIDYSLETPDGLYAEDDSIWRARLSLTHHSGCYSHVDFPLVNGDAIPFGSSLRHDDTSYHLVAPAADFNWLGFNLSNTIGRFHLTSLSRGEVRSHEDILDLTGIGPIRPVTEYGFHWDIEVATATCDCGSNTPQIYLQHDFANLPGTTQPDAYGFCFDTNVPAPYPLVPAQVFRLPSPGPTAQLWPFFRLEIGSWGYSDLWNGGVSLFACGGQFYMQDLFNQGNTGPFPDNSGEGAHNPMQLVWGVTTDHALQDSPNMPAFVIPGDPDVTIYPTLLTDFANQLRHRDAYSPLNPKPSQPEVHFGDSEVMSSLVWQLLEQ